MRSREKTDWAAAAVFYGAIGLSALTTIVIVVAVWRWLT